MEECKGFDPPNESRPPRLSLGDVDPNTSRRTLIHEPELGEGTRKRPRTPQETCLARNTRRRQRYHEARNRRLQAEREAAFEASWQDHQVQQLLKQQAAVAAALLAQQEEVVRAEGNSKSA